MSSNKYYTIVITSFRFAEEAAEPFVLLGLEESRGMAKVKALEWLQKETLQTDIAIKWSGDIGEDNLCYGYMFHIKQR